MADQTSAGTILGWWFIPTGIAVILLMWLLARRRARINAETEARNEATFGRGILADLRRQGLLGAAGAPEELAKRWVLASPDGQAWIDRLYQQEADRG